MNKNQDTMRVSHSFSPADLIRSYQTEDGISLPIGLRIATILIFIATAAML